MNCVTSVVDELCYTCPPVLRVPICVAGELCYACLPLLRMNFVTCAHLCYGCPSVLKVNCVTHAHLCWRWIVLRVPSCVVDELCYTCPPVLLVPICVEDEWCYTCPPLLKINGVTHAHLCWRWIVLRMPTSVEDECGYRLDRHVLEWRRLWFFRGKSAKNKIWVGIPRAITKYDVCGKKIAGSVLLCPDETAFLMLLTHC